jgi:hypothetical protein
MKKYKTSLNTLLSPRLVFTVAARHYRIDILARRFDVTVQAVYGWQKERSWPSGKRHKEALVLQQELIDSIIAKNSVDYLEREFLQLVYDKVFGLHEVVIKEAHFYFTEILAPSKRLLSNRP